MSTTTACLRRSALSIAIMLGMPHLSQLALAEGEWFSLGAPDGMSSYARGVSSDGSAVFGEVVSDTDIYWTAFRWTGDGGLQVLSLGGFASWANAISADGDVVVGQSYLADNNETRPFRWTSAGGMQDLGSLGGTNSAATAISADGAVVAGQSYLAGNNEARAFRWTSAGGMQDLGSLGGTNSAATVISADGAVVAGYSTSVGDTEYRAFRWTSGGGMQNLGTLGGNYSAATAISADGSAVVGGSYLTVDTGYRAFRWTSGGGMQNLGSLGGNYSTANAISADGAVVAGQSYLAGDSEYRAFRWTSGGGMQNLGTLGGGRTRVLAMSADGSVLVGVDDSGSPETAFHWDEAEGIQSIADWTGIADTSFNTSTATGVSADGQTVSGYGEINGHTEAWLARKGGMINPDEWLQSLNASQQVYQSGEYLAGLALDGSHHRPLALYANTTGSNSCVWANGDVGNYGYGRDASVGLAEVGVCGSSGALTFGGSIGNAWQDQDFDYDGNLDVDGQFFSAEVNWLVPGSPVLLSALGMYGSYEADIRRGYANGAGQAISKGSTDLSTSTLRLRADWLDATSVADVSLSPYTSVASTKTDVDAYTETSGPFPASFDSQDQTATEARLGLTGRYALTSSATLSVTLETVHSMDDQGPNLSGQGVGLFSFDQEGQDTQSDWQRIGVEVDQLVGQSGLVSVSVFGANEGQDPNGSLAVKYIHRF